MARKFFVGGNFKMNPANAAALDAIVDTLNKAQLHETAGECWVKSMIGRRSVCDR